MFDLQTRGHDDDDVHRHGTGATQEGADAAYLPAMLSEARQRPTGKLAEAMKRVALRRATGLSRSTPIRPRSRKLAKVYRDVRVPLVRRLLAERPACEARFSPICDGRSTDCHERQTRAMLGSIVDEANVICLCRPCHDRVHAKPAAARKAGLLGSRWCHDDK